MSHAFRTELSPAQLEDTVEQMGEGDVDPYSAAERIVERMGLRSARKIDHIGIAVPSLTEAVTAWEALGFSVTDTHEVPTERVRVAFLPMGDARVELLEPTDPGSVIARFLERRRGLHHVCVLVEDLDSALEDLKARGVELVDEAPRPGAEGCRVAFVHPRSATGVLLELKEIPSDGTEENEQ
jgi:methylmalonyl-CoA/ethylmalonyl-CoA epimerase